MTNYKANLSTLRELVDNPTPRVPVAICADVSGSMYGGPIAELETGLRQYRDEMLADELTRFSAETALITFANTADCVSDFCTPDGMQLPSLDADGGTDMGAGLTLALDRLEARKAQYRSGGVDYYQPILVVMTDGQPNGDPRVLAAAIDRVRALAGSRKLTVIAVGLGDDADLTMLQKLCVKGHPVRMDRLHFRELFAWLSRSVSAVSASTPGTEQPLDLSVLDELASEPWSEAAL